MKTHTLVELSQASWQCRRDEVNCVTACSEFFAEFGADDAATAVGGINRYADIHGSLCFVLSSLYFVLVNVTDSLLQSTKHKVLSTKYKTQKLRQATLAIACLYLNLTHLLRGGQVRAGVY